MKVEQLLKRLCELEHQTELLRLELDAFMNDDFVLEDVHSVKVEDKQDVIVGMNEGLLNIVTRTNEGSPVFTALNKESVAALIKALSDLKAKTIPF